jgi:predicted permease
MEPENTRLLLAVMVVGGFLGIMGCWFVFPLKGDAQVFGQLLGTLGSGGFMVVIAYYFGSSANSKAKDDTIAQIAVQQPAAPPAAPGAGGPAAH